MHTYASVASMYKQVMIKMEVMPANLRVFLQSLISPAIFGMLILSMSQEHGIAYIVRIIPALVTEDDIYHSCQSVESPITWIFCIEILPSRILATTISHSSNEDEEQKNNFVSSKGAVEHKN